MHLALLLAAAQTLTADITVTLDSAGAAVVASYRLAGPADSIALTLIRFDGQDLEVRERGHVTPGNESGSALSRVIAYADTPAGAQFTVRYHVSGSIARIPLPVPALPTVAGAGAVTVRVRGVSPATRRDRAFPRLTATADGDQATLDHVPSLLRLPPTAGSWTVTRATDFAVIILSGLAVVFLLLRLRRVVA